MKKDLRAILIIMPMTLTTGLLSAERSAVSKAIHEKKPLHEIQSVVQKNPDLVNKIDIFAEKYEDFYGEMRTKTKEHFPLQEALDSLTPYFAETMQVLLKHGAVVNYVDTYGSTIMTNIITRLCWQQDPKGMYRLDKKPPTTTEKQQLEKTIHELIRHGASLYLGTVSGNTEEAWRNALNKLEDLRKKYSDTQKFRANLPDTTDEERNSGREGYTPKNPLSLSSAKDVLDRYTTLSPDQYLLSLDDVLAALAYKIPDAFSGNDIMQPILDYLKRAKASSDPDFKTKMRLVAALVATRSADNADIRESAQQMINSYGKITDADLLLLRCYYPMDKLNRYRDDRDKIAKLQREREGTYALRSYLPDAHDKKGTTKISLAIAKKILEDYAQLPQKKYVLSLDDVLTALAHKLPDAFLGGKLMTTQFGTTAIAQPILDYLKAAHESDDPYFKTKMRLVAALVAVRTAHKPDLLESAQQIARRYGKITNEDLLLLRSYYPAHKIKDRYRDDRNKIVQLLQK